MFRLIQGFYIDHFGDDINFCNFQINIDPESLKPKLPSRKDLRPYPTTCYLEYRGHAGPVNCISVDPSGQWLASGMCWMIRIGFFHSLLPCPLHSPQTPPS